MYDWNSAGLVEWGIMYYYFERVCNFNGRFSCFCNRAVHHLDFFGTNTNTLIMILILNNTDTDTFTTKCQHMLVYKRKFDF